MGLLTIDRTCNNNILNIRHPSVSNRLFLLFVSFQVCSERCVHWRVTAILDGRLDDRRQTERPIYVVYHEALRETTGRWGGHSAGACSTSRSLRCTARRGEGDVEIPPCSPRGSSGYWLDARLGPVGLAGVPQRRRQRCRQSRFEVRRNISSFLYMMTTKLLLLFLSCAAKAMPFQ